MKKIFFLILLFPSHSAFSQPLDDIEFINQINQDDTLLVMISGIKGFNDWNDFKELIVKDQNLRHLDIFIIGMKKKQDLESNIMRVQNALLNDKVRSYPTQIILSFSAGGFLAKQYVLDQLVNNQNQFSKLDYMIFIGTPYIENDFTISAFKKAMGFIFRPFLPSAYKDIVHGKKLNEISDTWYQKIENGGDNHVPNLTIFGRDDQFVKPEKNDSLVGESVIIGGNHRQLVQNINEIHCSFMIVRTKLIDKNAKIIINEMQCENR